MIPKYRVWDKDKKRMLYPCYDLIIEFHTMPDGKPYQCVFYGLEKVENFEIMPTLGVPDKNGKDIYSYDKISYSQRKNGTIQYNQAESRFEVFWSYGEIWKLTEHWLKTECEVTGNLFEDPTEILLIPDHKYKLKCLEIDSGVLVLDKEYIGIYEGDGFYLIHGLHYSIERFKVLENLTKKDYN